jgi:hypothetical protein
MGPLNRLLVGILPDYTKSYLTRRFPGWHTWIRGLEIGAKVWFNSLVAEVVKLSFLTVIVGVVSIAGLYFLGGSWGIFENTFIGGQYVARVNAAQAAEISWVLSLDAKRLGLAITLLTVLVSLVVGTVSQLTLLRRFFYVGRSWLVKLGWVALVSSGVAQQLCAYYRLDFYVAWGLSFIPTILIFSTVLASAGKLFPELNLLLFLENLRVKREVWELQDEIEQLITKESCEDSD